MSTTVSPPAPPHPPADVLTSLRPALIAIETGAQLEAWVETSLRSATGVGDVAFDAPAERVTVTLAPPVPVRELIADWQVARPYAVSGDVHQRSWSVFAWTDDLEDPYNRRIATVLPRFGRWQVQAQLAGRPAGPMPAVVSGASSAYDLRDSAEPIMSVTISPAR
jgi:hypothetical protein